MEVSNLLLTPYGYYLDISNGHVYVIEGNYFKDLTSGDILYTEDGKTLIDFKSGKVSAIVDPTNFIETYTDIVTPPGILFGLTSTGNGTGVSTLSVTVSTTTTFTLDGAARFYTDAGGTLGESTTWSPTSGATRTIYVKCTSGSSNMWISANTVTKWGNQGTLTEGWTSGTNAASLSGDISNLTALTTIRIRGNNTLSGSVAALTLLTSFRFEGSNTISGSVAGLTLLTYLNVLGSNTLSGSIAGLTLLTYLYVDGSNTISGSVAGLTLLTYLNVGGSNTLTGSITGLTLLTTLYCSGSNTISGDLNGIVSDLTDCYITGTNQMVDYTSGATWGNTRVTINPAVGYGYSSVEIDNMLIDMAASTSLISKTITLQGSSAARTVDSDAAVATLTGVGRTCTVVTSAGLPFRLTSTGDGTGVSTLSVTVSATTTFTLDGANANFYTDAAGTLGASKTWAPTAGGTRTIYVKCTSGSSNMWISANTVTKINAWTSGANAASLSGDISKLTSLTYLSIGGNNTISGSIAALTSLTVLVIKGSNTISGSIAGLTSLTNLEVYGSNTISGSIAALTSLTNLAVGGNNTLSGSIAALTSLTYLYVFGNNTLSGSIAALTSLTVLVVYGSNTISGSIAALTSLTNLEVYGSNTISGSIAGLTSLTNLKGTGSNTLSGDLNPIVSDLTECYLPANAMVDYTSGATWGNTRVTINPSATYGYSSAEIDNMLIDMAASVALISKTITLQGSSAARTAASNAAVATLTGVGRTCTVLTN